MISLIHPSRGRPQKAFANDMKWISCAGVNVEVILTIDSSDAWRSYFDLYPPYPSDAVTDYVRMYMGDHKSVVEATNRAAKESKGDILVYLSDDFDCPDNWGKLIEKEFEGVTGPMLLKVDDCLQKFDVRVLTIPIMNRALYERLGYFWHPEYKSMFVDEDLYWTCKNNGWLKKAPHLKFPHNHVSIGKAENDETYRRSAANWDQGKAVFARRKAAGFPL